MKINLIHEELSNTNWNDLFFNLNSNEMCLLFVDIFLGIV